MGYLAQIISDPQIRKPMDEASSYLAIVPGNCPLICKVLFHRFARVFDIHLHPLDEHNNEIDLIGQ